MIGSVADLERRKSMLFRYPTDKDPHPRDTREQYTSEWPVPRVVGIILIAFVLVPEAILLGH
jgi:hypothetical protein